MNASVAVGRARGKNVLPAPPCGLIKQHHCEGPGWILKNTLALQIHLVGERQNVHAHTCSSWVSSTVPG